MQLYCLCGVNEASPKLCVYILHAWLYCLCGARSGSPQLVALIRTLYLTHPFLELHLFGSIEQQPLREKSLVKQLQDQLFYSFWIFK